ncbi:hypothetical protein B0H14DRAFT_2641150 [Mycena olivaceomarginata]|nr:hypothetical protein B0H14DRAFT_2641150 [Mycena olivaceomarginata]
MFNRAVPAFKYFESKWLLAKSWLLLFQTVVRTSRIQYKYLGTTPSAVRKFLPFTEALPTAELILDFNPFKFHPVNGTGTEMVGRLGCATKSYLGAYTYEYCLLKGPTGIYEENPIHRVCDEHTERDAGVEYAGATKSEPCSIVKFASGLWKEEELDWNYELRGKVGTKKKLVRANTQSNGVMVQCKPGSALWPRVKAVIRSDGKSHSLRRIPLFQSMGVGLRRSVGLRGSHSH